MNAPWTHTYFGAILSSYGTPLPSLSSCIPCEYLSGIIKWSNPQEVREVWHGVIAKWQTFDSSEKNEITSLTSWEITPSLDHTHTHTSNPHSSPTLCVRHCTNGHWEEPWGNKYMNIEIKSESKHRSAPIPPLSPAPHRRNRCQDINFHDVRNLGGGVAGKSSAVADYSCLCASVCSCVSVSPSPPCWDIIISDCLRGCLTFPF